MSQVELVDADLVGAEAPPFALLGLGHTSVFRDDEIDGGCSVELVDTPARVDVLYHPLDWHLYRRSPPHSSTRDLFRGVHKWLLAEIQRDSSIPQGYS